jgi:GTP cyclohydrolase II
VANPEPCNQATPAPAKRVESAIALVMGDIHSPVAVGGDAAPIVRIHSQCLTGDVFHSLRCDCRQQLELALAAIADAGAGILIYENQEGRGIGLMAKLQAYELQDQGLDTIEANLELGYRADCREYELPAQILKMLNVAAVRLITNNPEKVEALEAVGIAVVERISAEVAPEPTSARYLQTKREKMGHLVS